MPKKKNFLIYDCFTYNNEDLILKIRLNYLNKFVDKFIIVEATRDHSGKKKKLNFNLKNFKKFKNKIRYIIVKDIPIRTKSFYQNKIWWHQNHVRDQYQRNQIIRGLYDAKPDDLIMISDIDEIPDLKKIKLNNIKKCTIFYQKVYRVKFNLECKEEYPWQGTRILKFKYLTTPQEIRNTFVKSTKPWHIFRKLKNPKFVENAGWHFTSINTYDKIFEKFKAGAHGEINYHNLKNIEFIKNKLKKGEDILHKNKTLKKVLLDKSFPNYLVKNKHFFKKFILL